MPPAGTYNYPTIYFEGTTLPRYAATIDVATTNDIISDDWQEDWAVWWWRFVICVGASRTEKSDVVLRMADILRRKLAERPAEFHRVINEGLYGEPSEIYVGWLKTIDAVAQIAATRPECEWYGVENENP